MEVQQCMELTSTNRSRAYPIADLKRVSFVSNLVFREQHSEYMLNRSSIWRMGRRMHLHNKCPFGGDGGGVPHVPIPNTTVKPSSADGTWTAGSWESRKPPSDSLWGIFFASLNRKMEYLRGPLAQLVRAHL